MDGSTLRKWILIKCREVLIDRFTVALLWTLEKNGQTLSSFVKSFLLKLWI